MAVAYSAGRDSTALLHVTLQAATSMGAEVVALHVHHGLHPRADAWLHQAQTQCHAWAEAGLPVRLIHRRLSGKPAVGDSIEAWARRARYAALTEMAHEAEASIVLLAHHRRDQAETVLLQALRGAGVDGWAAMPASVERDAITWVRPWLDRSREEIEAYVQRHALAFVDDDSNADDHFARNRLRHAVWPSLLDAFPAAETSLARSAGWMAEARMCLAELAEIDLRQVAESNTLRLSAWSSLSRARRSNVLRAWLRARLGVPASAALVLRLLDELPSAGPATWACAGGVLRRYRDRLSFESTRVERQPDAPREHLLQVTQPGRYALPGWGGALVATSVAESGIPLALLAQIELRLRRGDERFQGALGRPARSLKKQFQALGIPAWQRTGPLVFSGSQLLYVPGLGQDVRVTAAPGQPQLHLEWRVGDIE